MWGNWRGDVIQYVTVEAICVCVNLAPSSEILSMPCRSSSFLVIQQLLQNQPPCRPPQSPQGHGVRPGRLHPLHLGRTAVAAEDGRLG